MCVNACIGRHFAHPRVCGRCQLELLGDSACLEKRQESGSGKFEGLELRQSPVFQQPPLTLSIHPLNGRIKEQFNLIKPAFLWVVHLMKLIFLQVCNSCLCPAGHSHGPPHPPSLPTQRWVSKECPTADTQVLEFVGTFSVSDLKEG